MRADKAQKELFTRYDQLNALWLKAEERLTKYHIPRSVEHIYRECLIDERDPGSGPVWDCLGLQKVKGKWRICWGSYCYSDPEPSVWTPITECSAEIRVGAAMHLPGLEEAVVKSAETFIPRVDGAIQALADAIAQPDPLASLLAERAKLNGRHE